jgi:hypothetical protein
MSTYRVVWSLVRGPIDEPVDVETQERLGLMDYLSQVQHSARMALRDVFPADCGKWRPGVDGTPVRIPLDERSA